MRYVIIGAGAIGGTLATRLAQHGTTPPLVVARGANADAITALGLRLRSPDDEVTAHAPVVTVPRDAELTTDDVLVFATKTHQLQAALLEWVDQPVHDSAGVVVGTAGELLPALTALNGVEAERLAQRWFRRVYGVCVWLPAAHLAPGEFIVRIAPVSGMFVVGRYGPPIDVTDAAADDALLEAVRADWERASFRVHPVAEVSPWKYRKLLRNLGNAVQALLGTASVEDDAIELYDRARDEGLEVYAAAGIGVPTDEEEAVLRADIFKVRPVPGYDDAALGGSSWQSLARGDGSIETDYLNGEIVRLARASGVTAPVNEVLQRLARRAAAERLGPASVTAADLAELLERP